MKIIKYWSYKTGKARPEDKKELTGSVRKSPRGPLKLEEIFETTDSTHLGREMEGGDRFPADNIPHVWLKVYDMLDPKDKLAFSGASSVWHDWVEPKRTENLISEVAVADHVIDIKPSHPVYSEGVVHARELCQSWKEGIDQEIQTHGSNLRLNFEIASNEWHPCRPSRLCTNFFEYTDAAEKFMKEMRTHAGNPFPGRRIGLGFSFDSSFRHDDVREYWRDYWRSISLLLEKFGSHVHFAEICFDDDDDWVEDELGNVEGQAQLRECLLRLPNLKKVVIIGELFPGPFVEDEIREFYGLNPLPRLEHLEAVEVTHTSLATVDEVLRNCCVPANITRLSVYRDGKAYSEHLRHFDAVYGFENLEVLKAPILFRHLERLASLERRPPLREVDLSFGDAPYLDDVFMLLQAFGETLIQFRSSSRMRLRNDVVDGEPFSCNLPHLKKIFFKEYWGTAELLFQFKSLSHVEIWRMRDDTYWQFPVFKERLEDSTIWILMPCLQRLSLGNRATVYERVVVERPRPDSIDNHNTTGLQGRKVMEQRRVVLEQQREVLKQQREVLKQQREVLEQQREDWELRKDVLEQRRKAWEQRREVLEQPREVLEQPREVLEQRREDWELRKDVLEQRRKAWEQRREVLEQPRLDCIDNHDDTTGLQGRTWSQECRLVLVEVLSSVLTDFFHGLLF